MKRAESGKGGEECCLFKTSFFFTLRNKGFKLYFGRLIIEVTSIIPLTFLLQVRKSNT